jgi:hypothetical protein
MSAAQIKAQANFKKAIAYRKKTGCSLKEAFAHVKGSKVTGLDKVVKKGNKTTVKYTKKAKKKAAPKKKVSQGVLFGIKKKAAKNNPLKSTHKDVNSHNVKIKIISGLTDHYLKELNHTIKVLQEKEKALNFYKTMSKIKDRNLEVKKNDKELMQILKVQIVNLKKHLTQIKKHIK